MNACIFTDPPTIVLNQSIYVDQFSKIFTISPVINLGEEEVTVTWSRNGQNIDPSDSRVTISSGGALTVSDVRASDRGVYTVTASNIAIPEGVMASINVFIACKSIF